MSTQPQVSDRFALTAMSPSRREKESPRALHVAQRGTIFSPATCVWITWPPTSGRCEQPTTEHWAGHDISENFIQCFAQVPHEQLRSAVPPLLRQPLAGKFIAHLLQAVRSEQDRSSARGRHRHRRKSSQRLLAEVTWNALHAASAMALSSLRAPRGSAVNAAFRDVEHHGLFVFAVNVEHRR